MKDTATIARERQEQQKRQLRQKFRRIGFAAGMLIVFAVWVSAARASEPTISTMMENGRHVSALTTGPYEWASGAVRVYHNNKGAPMNDSEVEQAIKYIAWSIGQRTDLVITYGGLTTQDRVGGAIVLHWMTAWEMFVARNSLDILGFADLSIYPSSGAMASAKLTLQSTIWPQNRAKAMHTAVHEFMHVIGVYNHNPNPDSVLHATQTSYRYTLTPSDVQMTAYNHHVCHAELTPEGDVYVPGIIGAGVTLKPAGGVLTLGHEHHTGSTCSGELIGSGAVIYDVRGIDGSFKNVLLKQVNGGFEIVGYQGVE